MNKSKSTKHLLQRLDQLAQIGALDGHHGVLVTLENMKRDL
jgi:hypothetical protein